MKNYGERVEFPQTGMREIPKNPALVPGKDLKYAQVIKNRKGRKLKTIEKRVIFGKNIDQMEISTSLLERQNLTFRQDNKRISRKTIGFSKKIEWLYNQMKFYCTHFNFCRDHIGLTKEKENGLMEKNTPEKEFGIIKSKWAFAQLLNYRCIKISTN